MNSLSPSQVVGGFEVLEIPNDPYHGQYKQSCFSQNCYVPGQAVPGYFEYYKQEDDDMKRSSSRAERYDTLVLLGVFAAAVFAFCILRSYK